MRIDVATLYLTQFSNCALITFAVLAIGLRYPRELPLKLWGAAGLSATIGTCLIFLRGSIPLWISVEVGNILIYISLALTWLGSRALEGRKLPWAAASGLVLGFSAMLILISDQAAYFEWRSLLYSSSYLIFHVLTLATLLRSPSHHLPGYRVVSSVIILLMAAQFFRIYLASHAPPGTLVTSAELATQNFISCLLEMAKFLAFIFVFIERLELKLYRQAMHDELTGLYNRRAFYENAERRLKNNLYPQQALLVADLDFFKNVNDTYGHYCGDLVLQAFAGMLRKVLGPFDALYARNGGEEFVVLLSGDAVSHARLIAEKIREQCSQLSLRADNGEAIHQTVSIGVCSTTASSLDLRQMFMQADMALYHAKENGRNQVCLSGTLDPETELGQAMQTSTTT